MYHYRHCHGTKAATKIVIGEKPRAGVVSLFLINTYLRWASTHWDLKTDKHKTVITTAAAAPGAKTATKTDGDRNSNSDIKIKRAQNEETAPVSMLEPFVFLFFLSLKTKNENTDVISLVC